MESHTIKLSAVDTELYRTASWRQSQLQNMVETEANDRGCDVYLINAEGKTLFRAWSRKGDRNLQPPALEHPPLRSLSEVQKERDRVCICTDSQPCASHAVIPRLSHACQYTNCNHCDGRGGCACECHHRVPVHLENRAATFAS